MSKLHCCNCQNSVKIDGREGLLCMNTDTFHWDLHYCDNYYPCDDEDKE